jgi:hypothetical protein
MLQAALGAEHNSNNKHTVHASHGIALSTVAEKRSQLNSLDSSSIKFGVSV